MEMDEEMEGDGMDQAAEAAPDQSAASARPEKLSRLQKACLYFCIVFLDHRTTRREYDSPLVYALVVLGVKEDGWKGPQQYPPILSAIVKTARFMVHGAAGSDDLTRGNWLHDFYDFYTDEASGTTPETQASLQLRTLYNHPLYPVKQPAGTDRLHNIIQIGAECVVFDPLGPSIMSLEELDHSLLKAYNDEQTPADIEHLRLFETNPDFVDDQRGSKRWEDLAKAGGAHADHTLSNSKWDESLVERTERA